MEKVIQVVVEHSQDASGKLLLDALTSSKTVLQTGALASAASAGGH
jgi:hypothetical protein